MSLRNRTLLTVGGVLLLLVVALIIAAQMILVSGFEQLEDKNAREHVERVTNTINDEISAMLSTTADWAHWDDTYNFILGENDTYVEDNLSSDTLINLDVNLMIFINTEGEIIFSRAIDTDSGEDIDLPEGLDAYLNPDGMLVHHTEEMSAVGGILLLPDGPLMVTSRPILTNQIQGPIHGALILGRFFDAARTQLLSDTLKLDISLYPLDEQLPDDLQTIRGELTDLSSIYIHPVSNTLLDGYGLLADVDGNPALLLAIHLDRDILAQGQATFSFFAASLVVIALVGGLVTTILLDRTVLSRIDKLRGAVENISATGDLSYRVTLQGQDELTVLGTKLNEMLEALKQAQQAQRESDSRLRTLVNNAPVVLWAVDASGKLTLVDGNELKNLDIEPEKMIGQPLAEWIEKLPMSESGFQQALTGETVTTNEIVGESSFSAYFVPVSDPNGTINGVIGVATNITDRIQAEAGLEQANADLDRKNRQLIRSHELLRSTVEQLTDTIQRGASADELRSSVSFIQRELEQIEQ